MNKTHRLHMPLGEAIFSLRAIRRFKHDPISELDIKEILEAAIHAPNGGNQQPWHFIVVNDPALKTKFGSLYKEAWWAKRKDEGILSPEDIAPGKNTTRSAMRLADEISSAPVIVLMCFTGKRIAQSASIIPAAQNMLLAARALGIGGTITTLHPQVDDRIHKLFDIPEDVHVVYCLPFGYPVGRFGPTNRKPLAEVCSYNGWM